MESAEEAAALARRCRIVLALLRDAGAEDLAGRLTVAAADAIYHDLVHIVGRAVERWRAASHAPGCPLQVHERPPDL